MESFELCVEVLLLVLLIDERMHANSVVVIRSQIAKGYFVPAELNMSLSQRNHVVVEV